MSNKNSPSGCFCFLFKKCKSRKASSQNQKRALKDQSLKKCVSKEAHVNNSSQKNKKSKNSHHESQDENLKRIMRQIKQNIKEEEDENNNSKRQESVHSRVSLHQENSNHQMQNQSLHSRSNRNIQDDNSSINLRFRRPSRSFNLSRDSSSERVVESPKSEKLPHIAEIQSDLIRTDISFCELEHIPSTPKGKEIKKYKYCCPLCFQYYNFILVTLCCKNYICHFCVQRLKKASGDSKPINCPWEENKILTVEDVNPKSKVRTYSDSAKESFINNLKECSRKKNGRNLNLFLDGWNSRTHPNTLQPQTPDNLSEASYVLSSYSPTQSPKLSPQKQTPRSVIEDFQYYSSPGSSPLMRKLRKLQNSSLANTTASISKIYNSLKIEAKMCEIDEDPEMTENSESLIPEEKVEVLSPRSDFAANERGPSQSHYIEGPTKRRRWEKSEREIFVEDKELSISPIIGEAKEQRPGKDKEFNIQPCFLSGILEDEPSKFYESINIEDLSCQVSASEYTKRSAPEQRIDNLKDVQPAAKNDLKMISYRNRLRNNEDIIKINKTSNDLSVMIFDDPVSDYETKRMIFSDILEESDKKKKNKKELRLPPLSPISPKKIKFTLDKPTKKRTKGKSKHQKRRKSKGRKRSKKAQKRPEKKYQVSDSIAKSPITQNPYFFGNGNPKNPTFPEKKDIFNFQEDELKLPKIGIKCKLDFDDPLPSKLSSETKESLKNDMVTSIY